MRPSGARLIAMRVVAVLMGLVCGLLMALIIDLIRANPVWNDAPSPGTSVLTLAIGWAFCVWLLLRRARGILVVLQRAFLLGMVQWIVAGALFIVLGAGSLHTPGAEEPRAKASWEPSAPNPAFAPERIGGSVTVFLAAVCLAGWGAAFIAERMHRRALDRRTASVASTGLAAGVPTSSASRGRRPELEPRDPSRTRP